MAVKMSSSVVCVVLVMVAAMATTAPTADAQISLPFLGQITGTVFQIGGTVLCAINATLSAPPFPNANVTLRCGNTTVASTTTNSNGAFTILLNALSFPVRALTQNCTLVVPTPLNNCNATLPALGGLVSPVQAVGTSFFGGLFNLINFASTGFQYVANLIGL